MLQQAGAQVVAVSLPSTLAALSAYYLIASAEAASNLSRYDGVRYGYRAVDASPASDMHRQAAADNAAERLHELYKRTRHQGFGAEVRRRLMIGNFALSRAARAEFYDAACRVRQAVASDFDAVFRPVQPDPNELIAEAAALDQPVNRFLAQQAVLGSAPTQSGVDVLLTPTSPTPPWLVHETAQQRPVDMYMHDVMTVPASLARLPAVAVPLSLATYPADALRAFEAAVKAAASNSDVNSTWSPAALHAAAAQASSAVCVPTGVQLLGRYCDERTLLRVGATLESQAAFKPPAYCSFGAA
jgi:aspartyl-tRNA(Asn)/glutamyl-tRNA(Gln) amidotransferase subunit A